MESGWTRETLRLRRAIVSGFVASLAYGAVANLLTFVVPGISGWPGGTAAVPLVLQGLITLLGLLASLATATVCIVAATIPIRGLSRLCSAGLEACGAISLGLAALVLAVANRQPVLLACALLTIAVAFAGGWLTTARAGARRSPLADGWTVALLLGIVPYLADMRPRAWGSLEMGGFSLAGAVLAAAGCWWLRRSAAPPRRVFSTLLLGVIVAAGLAGPSVLRAGRSFGRAQPTAARSPVARPNVLLVVMDTVRADHTSVCGYAEETTPALRAAWTAGATLYTRAFSASDWTLPSTASLFTGLLASRHGAIARGDALPSIIRPDVRTLAEYLNEAGFSTYGIVANYAYLDARFGFGRGFDYYSARRARAAIGVKPWLLTAAAWRLLPPQWRKENRTAESVTGEAADLLRGIREARAGPFFIFLNYMDAHIPYLPPDEYRRRFGKARPPFSWSRYQALETAVLSGARAIRPDEQEALEADYDAGIAYIDANLGALFDELRRLGLYDDTLVIVTSDHGEMFGRSGVVGHGAGLFPATVHVPLLVKYPGQRASRTVDAAASGADILPTVLAAVGLRPAVRLDGRNLLENSDGEPVAFAESFELGQLARQNTRFVGEERAAFVGPAVYRILRDGSVASAMWQGEGNRVAGGATLQPRPDLIAELRELAEESRSLPFEPVIDPDVVEALRSLGYLRR